MSQQNELRSSCGLGLLFRGFEPEHFKIWQAPQLGYFCETLPLLIQSTFIMFITNEKFVNFDIHVPELNLIHLLKSWKNIKVTYCVLISLNPSAKLWTVNVIDLPNQYGFITCAYKGFYCSNDRQTYIDPERKSQLKIKQNLRTRVRPSRTVSKCLVTIIKQSNSYHFF